METKSCGCREHRRTMENAQDEILHNSISPLGPNPEVHAENFPYIRQRKTVVRLQQKIHTPAGGGDEEGTRGTRERGA